MIGHKGGIQKYCQSMGLKKKHCYAENQGAKIDYILNSDLDISGSDLHKQLESNSLAGCIQPFPSVVLICSNTGEELTFWKHVQPFSSMVSNLRNDRLHRRGTHHLEECLAILVSGSNLVKRTHNLEACSAILVSSSGLHWRVTHFLETCSAILVSVSDLLKHWRETHSLEECSAILLLQKHQRDTHFLKD